MAVYSGVNPHTAADLLRQAMAQNSARHEAMPDIHDQIGSGAPTPSGIQTPQPDPSDKRLPGIIHSYFGQVGSSPSSNPDTRAPFPVATISLGSVVSNSQAKNGGTPTCSPSSSASSASKVTVNRGHPVNPSPPEPAGEQPQKLAGGPVTSQSSRLPPTPVSAGSSILQKEVGIAESGKGLADGEISSVTQALKDLVLSKSSLGMKARRHQSLPMSRITTDPVFAAHISNPTTFPQAQSPKSSDVSTSEHSYKPPTSSSFQKPSKLTLNAADESRIKNTPPQTPRALSHAEGHPERKSPLSSTSSHVGTDGPRAEGPKGLETSHGHARSTDLPINSPKGKLAVKINEARGLNPSYDPFVVCVFEWNEYISKGPRKDAMDVDDQDKEHKKDRKETLSSMQMKRTDSDTGRPLAIPMKSRQSSNNSNMDGQEQKDANLITDPQWDHEAMFDVLGKQSEIDISVYDRSTQEAFLGHVKLCLSLSEQNPVLEGWFTLEPRPNQDEQVSGEIHLRMHFTKTDKKHFGPNDFQILKLIGKGTFGQVYQVRKKDTQRIYAMKVLSKKVIIQKKEVAHTVGERNILVRTAMADSPFIVGLKFSFQTPSDLYLVTDFMSGGELFWHLQKEGRFKEDRAKFYIAELILALQHLHQHDIVYRDLKPENILLDANGHIALCDFGLSKANLTKNDTTNTFCGTTEYLAPEVLLDEQGYTKMVDFWSLGVLVFEMCCGWSPFYAEDTQQMYKNIAFGKVRFPRDALSTEGRNFVKGLLNRNPKHRLGANRDAQELIEHPFFKDIDWVALGQKNLIPPFKPKLRSVADTSNFDPEFTNALNTSSSLNARAAALAAGANAASTPLSPTMQNAFRGFTFVDESTMDNQFGASAHRANDVQQEDDSWIRSPDTKEHRMSGVVKTGGDDNIFNADGFDM